jgi:hypothetical protein
MSRFKERLKKLEKTADKLMRLRGLGPYKCEREEDESNRQSRLRVALAILDLELTAIYEHYKNSDEPWSRAEQEHRDWLAKNRAMRFWEPELLARYDKLCAEKREAEK